MNEYVYNPKAKSRVQQINENLMRNIDTIYRLRKIQYNTVDNKPCCAYAVSLAENHTHSLKELTLLFYEHLKNILSSEETLTTENKCFKIMADGFEVTYCIEAWRKHADKTAYIENGEVITERIHRMSCEQAAYVFKKHKVEPFELLNTLEALQMYSNPAERYTSLAKMPFLLKAIHSGGDGK